MEAAQHVSALLALAAGFLSFVSPCVLPLVPSYMVFVTGLSFDQLENESREVRRLALRHSLAFVAGFAVVFVTMGASATFLGRLIFEYQLILVRVGGIVILLLGLYLVGAFKLMALDQERRIHLARKPHGLLGSSLVGITFALGWTPCIGPILGSILLLASTSGSVGTGMYLLAAYALGLGVPFLIAGVAFPWFIARTRSVNRHLNKISKISGVLLIAIGLLMASGMFGRLTGYVNSVVPTVDLEQYLPRGE